MMPHNHLCISNEINLNLSKHFNIYQKYQLKDTVFTVGRVSKKNSQLQALFCILVLVYKTKLYDLHCRIAELSE